MAAGLGFKTFTTGEVLTAGDTNGYLMQGVLVFASAAARDAAITSPQEGQFAYLKDTNVTTYYTGSAWANLDTTGMTNPMTTTGDTIYSSSGSTPARLGIGSTGQILTVAAGVPSWATPAGASGGMTEIANGSLTGSSVTISSINQSYYNLQLVIENFYPATSGQSIKLRFNGNSGSNYIQFKGRSSTSTPFIGTDAAWYFDDNAVGSINTSTGTLAIVNIYNYAETGTRTVINSTAFYTRTDPTEVVLSLDGLFNVQDNIDSITIETSSGNFGAGSYNLYGVK